MKVLLCTPYLQDPNVVSGGINVWGNNVWQYYNQIRSDIELDIVSYDRRFNVQEDSTVFQRVYNGILDYSRSIKETKQKLKKDGFNVLHLCTSAQLGLFKDLIIIWEAHKRGVKVALHLHFGRVPDLFKNRGWELFLFKKVVSMADAIIAIDTPSYKTLIENGVKQAYYLPNPLSLPIIQQIERERGQIKHVPRKILYVGHVIPTKGVFELATACNDLNDIELHYVGSITDEIRKKIENSNRDGEKGCRIIVRGAMLHTEVIREMLSCDIFVLPSYTEGFPNVILEAMACGCAIVASKVGAIPEMLEEEDNKHYGLLVEACDTRELEKALERLIKDDELKDELRKNAIQRVNERYAISIVWNQLVTIWENLN